MNNRRRNALSKLSDRLNEVRDEVEEIRDEEDETRDCMPENLQASSRYEESERCSEVMDAVINSIDEAIESLGEIV